MSSQEDLSTTLSLQPPPSRPFDPDDILRKTNGAPTRINDQGSDPPLSELPQSTSNPQVFFTPSPSSAMAISRAGTLSWQQRPESRGSSSRPLSTVAPENDALKSSRAAADLTPTNHGSMSRSQISQSLGSKEPGWFKQTQDRGVGSAALRRDQDDLSETASMIGRQRLPGMSRDSTAEPEKSTSPVSDSVGSVPPSREASIRGFSGLGHKYSNSESIASAGGIRSPLPTMSSQRFDPPSKANASIVEDLSIGRTLAMSPAQGRLPLEHLGRPASPTKGLGGFVQSAMLKRSDSFNKRGSAPTGLGLSRVNSIASNRTSYEGARYSTGGFVPLKDSGPNSISRENSTETNSRPGSSHSNATLTQGMLGNDLTKFTPLASIKPSPIQDEVPKSAPLIIKPPTPSKQDDGETIMSPPVSPSKKWSPTKASWLENAINKPDHPVVKSAAPQQPAWMAEINRAKQQRGSTDVLKGGTFKEVATSGLIRSPPPGAGYKPSGISGLPSGFSAGVAMKPRTGSSERVSQPCDSPKAMNDDVDPRESSSPHTPLKKALERRADPHNSPTRENLADSPSVKGHNSQLRSRTQSPTAAAPKPETPPKRDFKSTLKSRPASGEAKSKEEPEFKNVFGHLKRTKTQNYKAPNELKENILRGKAGLALTSGPKSTMSKDEFKESILKKKERMVVPSVSTKITNTGSKVQGQSVPESIVKRHGLTSSESLLSDDRMDKASEPSMRDKPKPIPPEKKPDAAANAEIEGTLGGGFTSSLAGMLQRGPSPLTNSSKPTLVQPAGDQDLRRVVRPTGEKEASVGLHLTHATKARARGPKRRLPTANKQDAANDTPLSQSEPQSKPSGAEARPLGPIKVTKTQTLPPIVYESESKPLSNIKNEKNKNRKTSQPSSPRKPSASIAQSLDFRTSSPTSQGYGRELQNKPLPVLKKKPALGPEDTKTPNPLIYTPGLLMDSPLEHSAAHKPSNISVDLTSDQERREPALDELDKPTLSVKGAPATWGRAPLRPSQPRSPVKLHLRKDEGGEQEEALTGSKGPTRGIVGLGIGTIVHGPEPSLNDNLPSPVTRSPKSPPLPGKKPALIANRNVSTNLSLATIAPPPSVTTQLTQPSQPHHSLKKFELFADIFDEYPSPKTNIGIDTQSVLGSHSSSHSSLKIKTLRKQIFEITDNGKSVPVPSHQEHILFEDCMYLCTHVFGTLVGTRTTEVYLWCGDGVPSSSIEETQLFAKKVAKDKNGKLIVIKQGKETTNFFQALGGIVILRRGLGSRVHSSLGTTATYLLCGRQHVGQIAFDEVDFNARSLCSGFPYIVSARSGNLYLWKGHGSGADELGCARLIGMDLGLTGEIEEIEEGQEPDAFWQSFPEGKRDTSAAAGKGAGYWHLKPSCEKYTTRLYRIDVEAPRPKSSSGFMQWGRRGSAPADTNAAATAQIKEIIPFAQFDLMDDGVFVLDAFFEIFM